MMSLSTSCLEDLRTSSLLTSTPFVDVSVIVPPLVMTQCVALTAWVEREGQCVKSEKGESY